MVLLPGDSCEVTVVVKHRHSILQFTASLHLPSKLSSFYQYTTIATARRPPTAGIAIMPPQADDKTALDYVTEAVKALNNASDNDFKLDYSAHIGDGYSNFIYKRRHASDKELWMSILDTGKRQKNAKWPFLVVDGWSPHLLSG